MLIPARYVRRALLRATLRYARADALDEPTIRTVEARGATKVGNGEGSGQDTGNRKPARGWLVGDSEDAMGERDNACSCFELAPIDARRSPRAIFNRYLHL